MKKVIFAVCLAFVSLASALSLPASANAASVEKAKNVVLVHGAWADGSSWADVIPYLTAAGLHVTSVQNPLTSLRDDVQAVQRALAQQEGPTVLAGHSYGGTVISEAGNDPKVTALVYVAARAPEAGEDFTALSGRFPKMPLRAGVESHQGFSSISEEAFLSYFANGVPEGKAKILFSVQQPIADDLFAGKTTVAAWQKKPSWYAVSTNDTTTAPDLQRFLAKRMNAHTTELNSGHLSLVSHPEEIAKMILSAAGR